VRCVTAPRSARLRSPLIHGSLCSRMQRYVDEGHHCPLRITSSEIRLRSMNRVHALQCLRGLLYFSSLLA